MLMPGLRVAGFAWTRWGPAKGGWFRMGLLWCGWLVSRDGRAHPAG